MGVNFPDGTDDLLQHADDALYTVSDLSWMVWSKNNSSGTQVLIDHVGGVNPNNKVMYIDADGTLHYSNGTADTDSALSARGTAWKFCFVKFVDADDLRTFQVDSSTATAADTNSSSKNPTGQYTIGARRVLSSDTPTFDNVGDEAYAVLWSVGLTANEMNALSRGVNPFAIEWTNVLSFCPLDGNLSPEPEYKNRLNMTLVNNVGKSTTNPPVQHLCTYISGFC